MSSFDNRPPETRPHDPRAGAVRPEDAVLAALHSLDALDADAARAFECRVDDDPALEAELAAMRAVADDLLPLAAEVEPPPELLQRVLASTRACASSGKTETPFTAGVRDADTADDHRALRLLARDEAGFQPLRVAGVSMRVLHRDDAAGYATVLVRMQPGAAYPAHRHGDDEECYVLEGDLQVGEDCMQAGDYQVARRGSVHPVQSTRSGCLLFLRSSLQDELLETV
jgi:quercetin dioxygenase-like cupin family protein